MKKYNKRTKSKTSIKDLAEQLSHEFDIRLPVNVLPNGDIVYKEYIIKKIVTGNWGVFDLRHRELKDQFYLKTCALMAAKAYNSININKYNEIKQLDSQYWASHTDLQVYKKNIKTAKEFERFVILLNKLEETDIKHQHLRDKISTMFKWSFV
jgi:uncharacterized membrane protein